MMFGALRQRNAGITSGEECSKAASSTARTNFAVARMRRYPFRREWISLKRSIPAGMLVCSHCTATQNQEM